MKKPKIIQISKDEIIPLAQKMLEEKRRLVIMNGYVDKEGNNIIVYNYEIDDRLVTYMCKGEKKLPSITHIYGGSAQWCEEEICEMMPIDFEGLKKGDRLFLPDDFDGSGQILVVPLNELKKGEKQG
ncbi:NADH-quinone oxidoreductase subunit C [Haloimpatiens sp. FM7330]|uniref:NADH-quinone oxidoreductase subunit C n=1 Tax=Haloimpatiens sp. FM7330 TaxID=3298610 RepID=UPI0036405170